MTEFLINNSKKKVLKSFFKCLSLSCFLCKAFFMTLELKGRLIDMEKGYKHIPFLIFFFWGGGAALMIQITLHVFNCSLIQPLLLSALVLNLYSSSAV